MTVPPASKDAFKGYRSPTLDLLQRENAPVWSQVTLQTSRGEFSGLILPRSETFDDRHVVIKMPNGYNVGIHIDRVVSVEEVGYKPAVYKIPEKAFPVSPDLPNVTLLGTGGTIASRLDYRTGAVIPAFTPGELYGSVPELADICNMETEKLYGVFSENMGPEQWMGTARAIAAEIEQPTNMDQVNGLHRPVEKGRLLCLAGRRRQAVAETELRRRPSPFTIGVALKPSSTLGSIRRSRRT